MCLDKFFACLFVLSHHHIAMFYLNATRHYFANAQLFMKLQAIKSEITDQQDAHVRERQEYEQAQEDLTRELKLK